MSSKGLFTRRAVCLGLLLLPALLLSTPGKSADQPASHDWPGWLGPDRTGVSRETGLLQSWPAEGPRLLWTAKGLGGGYSTPSVAAGRIYGMSYRGEDEVVWARDAATGQEAWCTRVAAANRRVGAGEGSRSTPSIAGDRLYTLGTNGDLVCLETATGKLCWQKSLTKEFGGGMPGFGYCESPLVDGDKVIVTPGGKTATLVALNAGSGDAAWKCALPEGDSAQYASAIAADVAGRRQYLQFLSGGVVGVDAKDGRFLWRYARPANKSANCTTPLFRDGCVFATSAYDAGGGLARLVPSGDAITAEEVYFAKGMQNHHGGVVLVGDCIYGFAGSNLACLDWKTGKELWSNRSVGKGSLIAADGRLYCRSERGTMALVEANPQSYVEKGRFEPAEKSGQSTWSHPVIANGKLYLRDQDLLFCYDVRAPMAASSSR